MNIRTSSYCKNLSCMHWHLRVSICLPLRCFFFSSFDGLHVEWSRKIKLLDLLPSHGFTTDQFFTIVGNAAVQAISLLLQKGAQESNIIFLNLISVSLVISVFYSLINFICSMFHMSIEYFYPWFVLLICTIIPIDHRQWYIPNHTDTWYDRTYRQTRMYHPYRSPIGPILIVLIGQYVMIWRTLLLSMLRQIISPTNKRIFPLSDVCKNITTISACLTWFL